MFGDDSGDEFVMMPTADGLTAAPWISGSPLDLDDGRVAEGGFLGGEVLEDKRQKSQKSPPPLTKEVMAAILEAMIKSGLIPLSGNRERGPSGSSPGQSATEHGTKGAKDGGDTQGENGDGLPNVVPNLPPPGQQERPDFLDNPLTKPGFDAAMNVLGNALGEGFKPGQLLAGAKDLAAGMGMAVVSAALTNLIKKLMPLDDDSSTAEYAAVFVGPLLLKEYFFGAFAGSFEKAIGIKSGPYTKPALRVGDVDEGGNAIIQGCGNVFIEGALAAREGDAVDKAGVACHWGAETVFIGGAACGASGRSTYLWHPKLRCHRSVS